MKSPGTRKPYIFFGDIKLDSEPFVSCFSQVIE